MDAAVDRDDVADGEDAIGSAVRMAPSTRT